MKTIMCALALSMALALPAYADDAHHPDQAPAVSASTPETTVQKMRDNTTTMQSQLDALAAARSPEERQKLLMEHMQTMRENMMLGRQMAAGQMGCPMMGDPAMMQGMGMMGPGAGAPSVEALAKRMHRIEQRLDRIQMGREQTP